MKTKRVAAILLMFLLALSHIAAQDDERKITPLEFKPDFVARELEAVPEIRSKLGLLRLEIDSKELGFIVGYTTAMDFDIPQITGLKPPANLDAILRSNPTPFIGARMVTCGLSSAVTALATAPPGSRHWTTSRYGMKVTGGT